MNAKPSRKLLLLLGLIVIFMFGFGFALVPIYNSLCKTLGINGKILPQARVAEVKLANADDKRLVLVQFVATKNSNVPWLFYPKTQQIYIHPGEMTRLAFYAENQSPMRMTVQAIPSVTPAIAAKYLKKTECFCFTQQTLDSHEAMDMPLLFHLDPDLPKDVTTITLSYALFDVNKKRS